MRALVLVLAAVAVAGCDGPTEVTYVDSPEECPRVEGPSGYDLSGAVLLPDGRMACAPTAAAQSENGR